jgi:hypothetical protein
LQCVKEERSEEGLGQTSVGAMMATTNYPNGIYTFMAVGTPLAENGYGWKLVGLQKILEFCAVIS